MSTDELTGVQALERKHPGLPMAPGPAAGNLYRPASATIRSR